MTSKCTYNSTEREFLRTFLRECIDGARWRGRQRNWFLGDNKESEPRLGGVGEKRESGARRWERGEVGTRGCQIRAWLRFVWLSSAHILRFANFLLSLLMSCLWMYGCMGSWLCGCGCGCGCWCESFCGPECVRVLQPQPVGRGRKSGGGGEETKNGMKGAEAGANRCLFMWPFPLRLRLRSCSLTLLLHFNTPDRNVSWQRPCHAPDPDYAAAAAPR